MTARPLLARRNTEVSMTDRIIKVLLACGVLSSLLYVGLDLYAASSWPEYSYRDHTVSELSAIGAPTRALWQAVSPAYGVLFLAFATGVFLAGRDRRALRITALLLYGLALVGASWAFFPVHVRGVEPTGSEIGHVVVAAIFIAVALTAVGFGAASLGRTFRIYSIATLVILLVAGAATFMYAPRVAANLPTPWMGALERVNVHGYMLWLLVLAVALLREQPWATSPTRKPRTPAGPVLHPPVHA